jgi:hypothetical protein
MTWWSKFSLARHTKRSCRSRVFSFSLLDFWSRAIGRFFFMLFAQQSLKSCTPKAHIYLKVILVQLNSWESHCLSLPLVAISTIWQRSGRHSIVRDGTIFLLFRATATATPTSLLQRVPWGSQRCPSYDEKNHFSSGAASLLAEPSRSFEHLKLILSETICLKLSKIIWNYSKMSETILSESTLSESKWKGLKVTASRHAKCQNGWRTEVVFELLLGLPGLDMASPNCKLSEKRVRELVDQYDWSVQTLQRMPHM